MSGGKREREKVRQKSKRESGRSEKDSVRKDR